MTGGDGMHNVTERLYIFSVYNSSRNVKENHEVHTRHLAMLAAKGYSVAEVDGRYSGTEEKSILLYGTNLTEPVVQEFSRAQLQESYLIVYHDAVAELVFNTGARKILGEFRATTEGVAKSKEAYSKIGNQWFIVE
jgi:hypothetical protein